jgi:uncharacterized protein
MSARDEALAVIAAHVELEPLVEHVRAILDDDPGHDLEHCLRVAGWTLRCGGSDVDAREALAAALLHDVVNLPKNDPRRAEASSLSAREARRLLPSFGFTEDAVDRVAEAIEDHSYSRGAVPRSHLGRALQDADRLEALGALGLFRTISTGVRMGARYFDAVDPWAERRARDDRRFTIDHFFTKLLALPETFHTEVGRVEARRRAALLELFLQNLEHELGRPRPPALTADVD